MTVKHPSALENIVSVLPLMNKEPVRSAYNLEAEEVMERAEVLDGELSTKTISDLSKKIHSARCQDDVVDVEEQICSVRALAENEQRGIGACGAEAELVKKRRDALVPGARCLLQPVEGTGKQAHVVGVLVIDKAGGLLAVHLLRKVAMEKGVGDIHLMYRPGTRDREV